MSALTRHELFVVVRQQVSDRAVLRRYLAVEACMEELAGELGEDPQSWGMLGLAAAIDAQLCAHNPERRGAVAAEIMRTEGLPEAMCAALRDRATATDVASLTRSAAALALAEGVVAATHELLDGEAALDDVMARAIAVRLERAARRAGDPVAARALAVVARVGVDVERAAALALDGMRRVRTDLRL